MITAAVIGASGYTGGELFRILVNHPEVKLVGAYDIQNVDVPVDEVHPNLRGSIGLKIEKPEYQEIGKVAEVIFSAVPHGVAMKFVPELLENDAKVIDLSADYRFDDPKVYERYYTKHESPNLKGVYGLPELHRDKIKYAKLIANPGCYPTAAILGLSPLVKYRLIDFDHIVIDAMSGTSGAGAVPSEAMHHALRSTNIQAYAITTHRHVPEIEQELKKIGGEDLMIHFTPHLVPTVRGILLTAHVFLRERISKNELLNLYHEFYEGEPFVRVLGKPPQLNFVVGSNYCDMGIELDARSNRLVIVAAIDNLLKGASGQAVQNMNIAFGLEETTGLKFLPPRP